MEIKVRIECPRCHGAGQIIESGEAYNCARCYEYVGGRGTGKVEDWLELADLAEMLGISERRIFDIKVNPNGRNRGIQAS